MKLYARNDIFKRINKNLGHDVMTVIRSLEKLQTKYGKVVADINYIKTSKQQRLIPTFAKVNISMKNSTHKLRRKISLLVMNTELENKHSEKRKLKKKIKKICTVFRADPEILERGGALCQSPWLVGEENVRFQMI